MTALHGHAATPPDERAIREACEWFIQLRQGSKADEAHWRRWLQASPAHEQAWRWVVSANRRFSDEASPDVLRALAQASQGRRKALKTLAFVGGLSVLGGGAVLSPTGQALRADLRASVGGIRSVQLDDGSTLWLDTATAVNVHYDATQRRLALVRGRILIDTAPDPRQRPFVVDAGDSRLTALGSRFTVQNENEQSLLAVFQGLVAVRALDTDAPARHIHAGEQIDLAQYQTQVSIKPAMESQSSWTQGLLVAQRLRLADFLKELGRYRHGFIRCAPELQDLRLVGVYPLQDTDAALDVLADTLPVRIVRRGPWWVSVIPA